MFDVNKNNTLKYFDVKRDLKIKSKEKEKE